MPEADAEGAAHALHDESTCGHQAVALERVDRHLDETTDCIGTRGAEWE